jgi:hypothetical protein
MKISVNINDYAVVYLTDQGRETYRKHYVDISQWSSRPQHHDMNYWMGMIGADGYLKLPLWEMMHIFGGMMFMGAEAQFKDNLIYVLDDTGGHG